MARPLLTHPASIHLTPATGKFALQVQKEAGTSLHACLHCRGCAGGCPFVSAMDMNPNQLLRMVQLGLKDELLTCDTIWLCVGCHTCSAMCPMAVDIAAVIDVLRAMALKEGVKVPEPAILDFHNQVLASIGRHGRTHKLEIMMRHKMATGEWFSDLDLGLKMLAKRKLDLRSSKVKDIDEIKAIFAAGREEPS